MKKLCKREKLFLWFGQVRHGPDKTLTAKNPNNLKQSHLKSLAGVNQSSLLAGKRKTF